VWRSGSGRETGVPRKTREEDGDNTRGREEIFHRGSGGRVLAVVIVGSHRVLVRVATRVLASPLDLCHVLATCEVPLQVTTFLFLPGLSFESLPRCSCDLLSPSSPGNISVSVSVC